MNRSLVFALIAGLFVNSVFAQEQARLLRFPAIHKDQIVFTYAGDLYSVASAGGVARKLTSHEGFEMFARFSPDGKHIAFTGQYDGNTEVYLMPAIGGFPQRLTYTATLDRDDVSDRMGPNNIVMTWTNDGEAIVFRSRMRSFNSFNGRLYSVSKVGGLANELPLPRAGFCSFSPDGKKLAYNRIFREFRTWKRYRGGMADDIWIYDFKTKKIDNITDHPAQDIIPMWTGRKIFFLSDRDKNKRMNLYVYDLDAKQTRRITHFTDFDIKFPSLGQSAIVFENGGFLYRLDINTEKVEKVVVRIQEDLSGSRSEIVGVADNVTNSEIAPDGMRALFGARGDVFTVPAKHGATRNLTESPGVHERNSKWSPDGDHLYYNRRSSRDNKNLLLMYNLKEQKETELGDIGGFKVSADQKKMLIASGGKYAVIDLPKSKINMKETLDVSGMEVYLNKKKQWAQIFDECWRQMREFFYVPNMHGVDWRAMHERYQPLVAYVSHRADLTYIIGEMIGELNVGHTYVTWAAENTPSQNGYPWVFSGRKSVVMQSQDSIESRRSYPARTGINPHALH